MKMSLLAALNRFAKKTDFDSINQMINHHVKLLNKAECKYVRTSDHRTLQVAADILKDNKFLKQHILDTTPNHSTFETESIPITISPIRKYPSFYAQYKQWKLQGKDRLIGVGGPSASDQTLIACMIPKIRKKCQIHFYCKDYSQSNIAHSAAQSHARHGNALNADQVLSGRHLLPLMIKRKLSPPTLQQVLFSDYIKVDIKIRKFKYLKVYILNQLNGIYQIIKQKLGLLNQHDLNRLESVASQQIQTVMESKLNIRFRSNYLAEKQKSMAIHVLFTKEGLKQIKNQQSHLLKIKQLKWDELTIAEVNRYFPHSKQIITAFRYHGDYSNRFDMHQISKNKCIQQNIVWKQNKIVSQIFIDGGSDLKPFVCGVLFQDGEFVPANKVHLSLGYKVKYLYENSNANPVKNIVVPATGVSMTIILKKTQQIRQIMKEKGKAMEIAIVNSHWTLIEQGSEYVLMRATAGGNTGSEQYMPSYFINLYANTRRIFGQALVGIVSAYGCSRSVNYKNSTQFAHVAEGLVISYGKGGTGNTKRSSQAYKALKYLGFGTQLQQFFSTIQPDRLNIVQTMETICKQSQKVNFYYNNFNSTNTLFKN